MTVVSNNTLLTAYAMTNINTEDNPIIEIKQEVKVWRYRKYNGKSQKRLWSKSRGVWLTDWIDCHK